jgi:putative membrane protein
MNLLVRIILNAVALYAAVLVVPGISSSNDSIASYLWLALIFGLVNALVKPFMKFISCGLIALTLGLFMVIINTLMFLLTNQIGNWFGVGLEIDGFWAAFFGGLVVSVVSFILGNIFDDDDKKKRRKRRNN